MLRAASTRFIAPPSTSTLSTVYLRCNPVAFRRSCRSAYAWGRGGSAGRGSRTMPRSVTGTVVTARYACIAMVWSVSWSDSTLNVDSQAVGRGEWQPMLHAINAALAQKEVTEVVIAAGGSEGWSLRGLMIASLR